MKKNILLLFLFILPFAVQAKQTFGAKDAPTKVLLAFEKTTFKKALIDEMVKLLDDGTISITVVDHGKKELSGESAADYDAVFITASGVESKIRPWILDWLKNQTKKDHVLLHITKQHKWETRVEVDSVSSASDKKNSGNLAKEYVAKIKSYIKK